MGSVAADVHSCSRPPQAPLTTTTRHHDNARCQRPGCRRPAAAPGQQRHEAYSLQAHARLRFSSIRARRTCHGDQCSTAAAGAAAAAQEAASPATRCVAARRAAAHRGRRRRAATRSAARRAGPRHAGLLLQRRGLPRRLPRRCADGMYVRMRAEARVPSPPGGRTAELQWCRALMSVDAQAWCTRWSSLDCCTRAARTWPAAAPAPSSRPPSRRACTCSGCVCVRVVARGAEQATQRMRTEWLQAVAAPPPHRSAGPAHNDGDVPDVPQHAKLCKLRFALTPAAALLHRYWAAHLRRHAVLPSAPASALLRRCWAAPWPWRPTAACTACPGAWQACSRKSCASTCLRTLTSGARGGRTWA